MSHCATNPAAASSIHTVAEAGTYIAWVCFKHGPPERTGIELEWLLLDPSRTEPPPGHRHLAGGAGPARSPHA